MFCCLPRFYFKRLAVLNYTKGILQALWRNIIICSRGGVGPHRWDTAVWVVGSFAFCPLRSIPDLQEGICIWSAKEIRFQCAVTVHCYSSLSTWPAFFRAVEVLCSWKVGGF